MGTTTPESSAGALFGKTRRAILGLLFAHPDQSFYVAEIIRAAGSGRGAVQRELAGLTRAGVIRRTVRGHQVFFRAAADSPVFAEVRGLVLKTFGVADVLRAALSPLADQILYAFIYGSIAQGTARACSDIDLCVVGSAGFGRVVEALQDAQRMLGREINPTVYGPAEFRTKLAAGHHFLTSISRGPKIMLVGDERELAGLAEERLARAPRDKPRRNRRSAGGDRA